MPFFPEYLSKLNLDVFNDELGDLKTTQYFTKQGQTICLYKMGNPNAERMVLLPPYGISYLLLIKLAKSLSKNFYILSWESKACPDASINMQEEDVTLEAQLNDFKDIIKQENFEKFHFVGWCQAAQFLVYALAYSQIKPQTISWIAPAGLNCALVKSEFERCALPVYQEIERHGALYAETLAKILDKHKNQPFNENIIAEKLTMLHLADPNTTYRFSKYMKSYEDNKTRVKQLLDKVLNEHAVFVIHCKDDTYSHYSEAVQLGKEYNRVTLQLLSKGGHLLLFNDPYVLSNQIINYIANTQF